MKRILLSFGHNPTPVKNGETSRAIIDNAEASGANGHKTDSIGY